MDRRTLLVGFAVLAIATLAPSTASADIVFDDTKSIRGHALLLADRFDDYCDHRRTIAEGDTLEKIARAVYGDAAKVGAIERANPGVVATQLKIGSALILPAKLAPPADAKETLAWEFYVYSRYSPPLPPTRIYPGERFDSPGLREGMVAVPAARGGEFRQLLATPAGRSADGAKAAAPWAIDAIGFEVPSRIDDSSTATSCTRTFRISKLQVAGAIAAAFELTIEKTEYFRPDGTPVKAGFGDLTEAGPLGLIALVGAIGLAMLKRRRPAAGMPRVPRRP